MHILISWDIKAEGGVWSDINSDLKECLKGFSWTKPLSTLYIVELYDSDDRKEIKSDLINVCNSYDEKIHFIITPVMQGGTYVGLLPKSLWPKIRKRTEDGDE